MQAVRELTRCFHTILSLSRPESVQNESPAHTVAITRDMVCSLLISERRDEIALSASNTVVQTALTSNTPTTRSGDCACAAVEHATDEEAATGFALDDSAVCAAASQGGCAGESSARTRSLLSALGGIVKPRRSISCLSCGTVSAA